MEWLNSGRASSIIAPNFQRLNDWPAFAETVKLIKSNAAGWPTELDLACRWYAPHLERRYEDARIGEADPPPARTDCLDLSESSALSDRPDA
jgi:hypothetical protein